ncbi:MAG TPA: SDR family oxidoreductase [Planctomycetes bacterium]|nr:SDR family oxidoreductase [Planctomycetota bacterium]
MTPSFTGEVAIVTGAGSGIGRSTASALAASGACVHGFDLHFPDDECGVRFHEVDVSNRESVRKAIAEVVEEEGKLDHLVQAAGIVRDRALWKLEPEEWSSVLDVNLSGAFWMLQEAARLMRGAGGGSIVHVASINGMRGKFGQANYAASKAGLIGLTRAAARELGPKGIRVNAVAPGMIETAMTAALPEAVRAKAVAETSLGRLGGPEQVSSAILFLLSDAAAHITGEIIRVDGGQMS